MWACKIPHCDNAIPVTPGRPNHKGKDRYTPSTCPLLSVLLCSKQKWRKNIWTSLCGVTPVFGNLIGLPNIKVTIHSLEVLHFSFHSPLKNTIKGIKTSQKTCLWMIWEDESSTLSLTLFTCPCVAFTGREYALHKLKLLLKHNQWDWTTETASCCCPHVPILWTQVQKLLHLLFQLLYMSLSAWRPFYFNLCNHEKSSTETIKNHLL